VLSRKSDCFSMRDTAPWAILSLSATATCVC
jgi:hypothetical protein